jgi:signal transduction histidine kinase
MSNKFRKPSIPIMGSNPVFVLRARRVGKAAAYLGILFTLTGPLSWLINVPILRPAMPVFTPTHFLGLFFSLFLAIAVLLLYYQSRIRLVKLLSLIILVCTAIVVLDYATPGGLPFAGFIRFLDPIENPNKIGPNGALCLSLSSLSALLLTARSARAIYFAQAAALLSASVAALAIMGHAYEIQPLYGIKDYSQMSVPGAVSRVLMSVALMCVWPEQGFIRILVTDGPAGVMGRRLYSAALLVPPFLGFLVLTSSQVWNWYELPFAIVLLVTTSITLFALVVAVTSRRLERADFARQLVEGDLLASRERLRELSAYTQVMQEEERVRIAREVHDELGQSLTALKMDVSMLRKQVPPSEDTERRMNSMIELVNSTIQSVRRISSELRPSVLDDLGLAAAIEWQAREFEKRSGLDCHVHLPIKEITANPSQATALFRIFQETLTNVARHANAKHVEVLLRETNGGAVPPAILLRVHDDGIGLDDQDLAISQSLGLMGMRERAALAGGTLDLEGALGEGMTVTVTMPKAL